MCVQEKLKERELGRPKCKLEDNIEMHLKEIGLGWGVGWIHLALDRDHWQAFLNTVVHLQAP